MNRTTVSATAAAYHMFFSLMVPGLHRTPYSMLIRWLMSLKDNKSPGRSSWGVLYLSFKIICLWI